MGQAQNGLGSGLGKVVVLSRSPAAIPALSADLQRQRTSGWNGTTSQVLSAVVDTMSRRRGRMPCERRIASEAKAAGNAADRLTEAR